MKEKDLFIPIEQNLSLIKKDFYKKNYNSHFFCNHLNDNHADIGVIKPIALSFMGNLSNFLNYTPISQL